MTNLEEYRALLAKLRGKLKFSEFEELLSNRVIDFISKNPKADRNTIRREMERIFGSTYKPMIDKAMNQYDDLLKGVNGIYENIGSDLSGKIDRLQALKATAQLRYGRFNESGLSLLQRTINKGLADGLSLRDLRDAVSKIGGRVGFYSETISMTQYSAYGQSMKNIKADLAGMATFEYVGNLRVTSRMFCQKHVGKIYTKSEIVALDNDPDLGQAGIKPVAVYKGGWGCAHDWEPVE